MRNVLSLFNGHSCGQIALEVANVRYGKYYSSEVDKFAIQSNMACYPNTIQLGDVRLVDTSKLENIDLLIGGSPCTDLSIAGKRSGLICDTLDKYLVIRNKWLKTRDESLYFHNGKFQESILFWEYVRIYKELKAKNPKIKFFLENVAKGLSKSVYATISNALGVLPYRLNSNMVSAQNRDRYYWSNINTIEVNLFGDLQTYIEKPKDRGLVIADILQPENEVDEKYYINCDNEVFKGLDIIKLDKKLKHICVAMRGRNIENGKRNDYEGAPTEQRLEPNYDGKSNCLTTVQKDNLLLNKSDYVIRRFTPRECGRLQTVPEHILDKMLSSGVSSTQLYRQFGNGWTIDAIVLFFKHLNK